MFCNNCGKEVNSQDNFCNYCGFKLKNTNKAYIEFINIDQKTLKKYYDKDETVLRLYLVPYKNNSCVKVYTFNDEPIADISEDCVKRNKITTGEMTLLIEKIIDDETGLIEYILTNG